MKNAVIAAAAAALLAGSVASFAAGPVAQATPGAGAAGTPPAASEQTRWRPSADDRAALTDARIASLKAGLKLSADQEKLWPAVETALRGVSQDAAKRRAEMQQDRRGPDRGDTIARLRTQAGMMTSRAADLTKIADAAEPLYKTLDEGQKHRLEILLRKDLPMGMQGPGKHGPAGHGPGRG